MYNNITYILFSLGFIIPGIVLIVFGYNKLSILDKLKKQGVKTVGEIERVVNPEISILSKVSYLPVVKFRANNEEIIDIPKNSIRSNPTFYKAGERYAIYYQSENPLYFAIENWTENACAWMIICAGGFFILEGVFGLLQKL